VAPEVNEFGKVTQNNGNYTVQGHSRSPVLVPMESPYVTSYVSIIVAYLLVCTVSEICPNIGPIFAADRACTCLTHSFGGELLNLGLRNLASKH